MPTCDQHAVAVGEKLPGQGFAQALGATGDEDVERGVWWAPQVHRAVAIEQGKNATDGSTDE